VHWVIGVHGNRGCEIALSVVRAANLEESSLSEEAARLLALELYSRVVGVAGQIESQRRPVILHHRQPDAPRYFGFLLPRMPPVFSVADFCIAPFAASPARSLSLEQTLGSKNIRVGVALGGDPIFLFVPPEGVVWDPFWGRLPPRSPVY